MTALAAARPIDRKGASSLLPALPVQASTKIYKGGMVAVSADGYAIPAADTAGIVKVIGVAEETVDNSAGAAGALKIRVQTGGHYVFAASSITQAMLGETMYIVDDQTFDDAAGPTNDIVAGILTEYLSTTKGRIYIAPPTV